MKSNIVVIADPGVVCSFEKIPPPVEEDSCDRAVHYSRYLFEVVGDKIEKIKNARSNYYKLLWVFWVISGLGCVAYLGFDAYLLHLYKGDGNVAVHAVLFACIFFYGIVNSIFTRESAAPELHDDSVANIYTLILVAYITLFCSSIAILFSDGYNMDGMISCILFVLATFGIGTFMITIAILFIIGLIIGILELTIGSMLRLLAYLLYQAICKNVCIKDNSNKPAPPNCSLYYYDKDKTKVTQCSICLCDFKEKVPICVGNCNIAHIFHANCMDDWLKKTSECPSCKSNSGFK